VSQPDVHTVLHSITEAVLRFVGGALRNISWVLAEEIKRASSDIPGRVFLPQPRHLHAHSSIKARGVIFVFFPEG
jgi:D-serine dehydratase